MIYLATPYTKYPHGRQEAFTEACRKAAELMLTGEIVFSPIAHSHPIENIGMTKQMDGDFWLRQDYAVLRNCSAMYVYKMPGWEDSYGVSQEIEMARLWGIPITYLDYNNDKITTITSSTNH